MRNYADDFPVLKRIVNGHRFVYLDSAATAMRPRQVLEAVVNFYETSGANPHRGVYKTAEEATAAYENARKTVANFVSVSDDEIVFTRNASESLNMVMYSWALEVLKQSDEIVIPVSEHHSNLVPWQRAAKKTGARLVYLYPERATGEISDLEIERKIGKNAKIIAFAHVSNVLGGLLPVEKLVKRAKEMGAVTVLDCAQSVPHFPVDLYALDVDFAAFSGHKVYAPMGIGVLYGRRELLEKMEPFLSGGDMIEYVREQETTYAPAPQKFEAGTQNAGGAVGLAAAIEYIRSIGWAEIEDREAELMRRLITGLNSLPNIDIIGNDDPNVPRFGVAAFNVKDVHSHDVATILDSFGIAIRAGQHCANPLIDYLELPFKSSCRASLGIYNTEEDIDNLLERLPNVRRKMGYGD
jgi:cysteine desulfurase/selenocysteine lyase